MSCTRPCLIIATSFALALSLGCESPLTRDDAADLKNQILTTHQQQLKNLADANAHTLSTQISDYPVEQDPKRVEELNSISGPGMYASMPLQLGLGLGGEEDPTFRLSLQQVIQLTVKNNLDIKIARLQPAVSEAQVVAAKAFFDAALFSDLSTQKLDQPQVVRSVTGQAIVNVNAQVSENVSLETGIRKRLESGGRVQISAQTAYANNATPRLSLTPDPSYTSNLTIGISQPLLRNFGSDFNRAQISITENTHRRDALNFQAQLLSTVGQAEQLYWQLVFGRNRLAIQQTLLDRTVETREKLLIRKNFDVTPVQIAQSHAFVLARRNDVTIAQQAIRDISDQLKQLINDPSLPMAGDTILIPVDAPTQQPVQYALLDAWTTALRKRPEVRQALLNIDDASIRQHVADNQRLPVLNLSAQVQYTTLEDSLDESYYEIPDADFTTYVVGAQFEMPIGNREAEANFRAVRIARQQSVIAYNSTVQRVALETKIALRALQSSWQLININYASRLAAAENLRTLNERQDKGEALTPTFLLDLRLNAQQRLADAEARELQSVVDYNIALARIHQVTGTLLEHNQIKMNWPESMFAD